MKHLILIAALSLTSLGVLAKPISIQISPRAGVQEDRPVDYLSYNFGRVWLNFRTSVAYEITNTGTTDLKIEDISIYGMFFDADTNCPDVLPAGKACTTTAYYTPGMTGMHSGRLVWETSTNDIVLDLWGEGVRN